eukprot:6507995-Pyramimonas_sp.AAC.1
MGREEVPAQSQFARRHPAIRRLRGAHLRGATQEGVVEDPAEVHPPALHVVGQRAGHGAARGERAGAGKVSAIAK